VMVRVDVAMMNERTHPQDSHRNDKTSEVCLTTKQSFFSSLRLHTLETKLLW
jgi:hypothetical protein